MQHIMATEAPADMSAATQPESEHTPWCNAHGTPGYEDASPCSRMVEAGDHTVDLLEVNGQPAIDLSPVSGRPITAVMARHLAGALIEAADLVDADNATSHDGHQSWCHDRDHNPEETACCTEAAACEGVFYLTTREDGDGTEWLTIAADLTTDLKARDAGTVALEVLRLIDLSRGTRGDGLTAAIGAVGAILEGRRA